MNIDMRQLRYFLAVADERSVTRGAERLHMAQPPLSRRIQELEAGIGAPLFERGRRPLRLTTAGQVMYDQAKLVLDAMDRLKALVGEVTTAPRARFTLGLVPSTLYIRIPEIIAKLRALAPDLEIGLAEMDSREQVRALGDGRIDVGFDRIVVDDPHLRHEVMREESLIVAVPADDPLLADAGPVPLARLAAEPLLLYPSSPRPSFADLVLAALKAQAVAPSKILEVRELQTAVVMVASGAGRCIVPESVRRLARPDIAFLEIAETISAPLLVRTRLHDRSTGLRQLLEAFADLYPVWGWTLPPKIQAWATDLGSAKKPAHFTIPSRRE
ncbi:LysR family transcriptional regulator [Sphingomonas nostoxanthinifaciens]|uniref:LysR family transcriptional regulator n=1 Tax=Sphingomonas nostoxanthinifaciens TaxID=2872652 RepID=UPI001CC213C1|nr:LysR family transcriptional regulator [Sphingomonas nostoxanthinifaciens]UAK23769.1 LysR family transcriptional regulator [Sphingomonas nostoxanthinifaciens]